MPIFWELLALDDILTPCLWLGRNICLGTICRLQVQFLLSILLLNWQLRTWHAEVILQVCKNSFAERQHDPRLHCLIHTWRSNPWAQIIDGWKPDSSGNILSHRGFVWICRNVAAFEHALSVRVCGLLITMLQNLVDPRCEKSLQENEMRVVLRVVKTVIWHFHGQLRSKCGIFVEALLAGETSIPLICMPDHWNVVECCADCDPKFYGWYNCQNHVLPACGTLEDALTLYLN